MKYEKEVEYRHLDSIQLCRAGVEVHFRDDRCYENGKSSKCRQKRQSGSSSAYIIIAVYGEVE